MAEEGIRALARSAAGEVVAAAGRPRRTRRLPLRRLAVRRGARQRRHGAASQAVPHARRQLQPAACRDAHDRAAACARLQREAAPEAMERIARALGAADAAQGAFELARDNGAPTALKDIGMKEADLEIALDIALKNPYWNPRPLERAPLRALLEARLRRPRAGLSTTHASRPVKRPARNDKETEGDTHGRPLHRRRSPPVRAARGQRRARGRCAAARADRERRTRAR